LVEHRMMMFRMAGRVDHAQRAAAAHVDAKSIARSREPVRGYRVHAPVQSVEQRPIYTSRAVNQTRRVDEMARTFLMHHDGSLGKRACEVPDSARMIEMDVRDDDPAELVRTDSGSSERVANGRDAALRTGLHQRGLISVDEESRGHAIHAAQPRVQLPDPGRDLVHPRSAY